MRAHPINTSRHSSGKEDTTLGRPLVLNGRTVALPMFMPHSLRRLAAALGRAWGSSHACMGRSKGQDKGSVQEARGVPATKETELATLFLLHSRASTVVLLIRRLMAAGHTRRRLR